MKPTSLWYRWVSRRTPIGRQYRVKRLREKEGLGEREAWESVLVEDSNRGCTNWSQWEIQKAGDLLRRRIEQQVTIDRILTEEGVDWRRGELILYFPTRYAAGRELESGELWSGTARPTEN